MNTITESWFETNSFTTYKLPKPEPFVIAETSGQINTLEGLVSYPAGSYIMTGPVGERYPITPGRFAALKSDNGDGTATPLPIKKIAKLADHDGAVTTSWGEQLTYNSGVDYIVRHGVSDYGVVKADIFAITYFQKETK